MIRIGPVPTDDHAPREHRIEAAEDRAEQVAFDAWREGSHA